MRRNSLTVCGVIVLLLIVSSPLGADEWLQGGPKTNQSATVSDACANYAPFSGPVSGPGSTLGRIDTFTAGDYFVFTATGNGTGSWRIVGEPSGTTTLASGGTFPGTLVYEYEEGVSTLGVGYFVDTYTGPDDTIFGECGFAPPNVPTLSEWSLVLMAALLGFVGVAVFRRRRAT